MAAAAILVSRFVLPVLFLTNWTSSDNLVYQVSLRSVRIWLSYNDLYKINMAAAAILDFEIHFRFSRFWTARLRATSPENFVKIAQAVQKLLHSYFCFVYNGNSLFPRKFGAFWGKRPPKCE